MLKKLNYFSYLYAEKYAGKDHLAEQSLHNLVISSILNFREFVPNEYKKYDLEKILISKAMYYNTSIDKSLRQYYYLSKALQKVIKNKKISDSVSKSFIDIRNKRLAKSTKQKTFEDEKILFIKEDIFPDRYSEKNELLFFASQPSHIKVIDCFFEFSVLEDYRLVLPFRLKDKINLENISNEKIIYFEEFLPLNSEAELRNFQKIFKEIYYKNNLEIKNLFKFDNTDFFTSQEVGIKNIFKFLLPQSLLFAISAERLLENRGLSGVVGVRPRRIMDRAILKTASNLGLNSSLIVHSTLGSDQRELWSSGLYDNITNLFGWGEKHSSLLEADCYFKKENYIKAGSPLFNAPPKSRAFRDLNPRIIYASSRNDNTVLSSLNRFNKQNSEVQIAVKIRPGQDIDQNSENSFFDIEPGTFAIEEILENYDILVTPYSGSHIAAISEGLPVIFAPFYYEFIQDLETLYGINDKTMSYSFAKNDYQLRSILEKVIKDSDYRKKLISQQTSYFNELVSGYTKKESVKVIEERIISKSK